MVEIVLDKGQVTKVSDHRLERLNQFRWRAKWNPHTFSFYAVRTEHLGGDKCRTVYLHREILDLVHGDGIKGDHVDGDSLNNLDENLRIANNSQNDRNRGPQSNNTSGLKGVFWCERRGVWVAQICVDGRRIQLGAYSTAEDAARAYNAAALRHFGEFAWLNPI